MSDEEGPRNTGGDDEVALPKATVHKLVQGKLTIYSPTDSLHSS